LNPQEQNALYGAGGQAVKGPVADIAAMPEAADPRAKHRRRARHEGQRGQQAQIGDVRGSNG
jgi:hypothetical protein